MQDFISSLSARYSFDRSYLERIFAKVRSQRKALSLIKPSKTDKSQTITWGQYRNLFVNQDNVAKGKRFISTYLVSLEKAHKNYGVPPEVIAAIIGIETKYGKNQGKFPVFDTLATLAFERSGRENFFQEELEAFILLCLDQGFHIDKIKGSYAGALGIPQFMPSSWKTFAVDFDQNGKTNLLTSPKDAIGSVANYLNKHGWNRNIPTHSVAVQEPGSNAKQFFTYALQAEFKYTELQKGGFKDPLNKIPGYLYVSLVDLKLRDNKIIYWLATENFFAITKYNRSYKYAAAVLELAEALKNGSAP
ncbi:lytic murein transglycosylase B [Betaproteobacteria bacterium]|nr:lytic murein transglycosylase B [Betaproteobacteria bacterium]